MKHDADSIVARIVFCFVSLFAASMLKAQTFAATRPIDVSQLKQTARDLNLKLKSTPCRWQTKLRLAGAPGEMTINWMFSGTGCRADFATRVGDASTPEASIIIRDGAWYVSQHGRFEKYQPYEVSYDNPELAWNYWLSLATTAVQLNQDAAVDHVENATAVLLTKITGPRREYLLRSLDEMRRTMDRDLGPNMPDVRQDMQIVSDALEKGLVTRIDLQTGQIVESTSPRFELRWSKIQWLEQADLQSLEVSDHDWTDRTAGPLAGDPKDLALVRCGQSPRSSDIRMVNLRTEEIWRLPFMQGTVESACFTNDRRSVVACGWDLNSGITTVYQIDLATRKYIPIGDRVALEYGICSSPAVSHDGRSLVILQQPFGGSTNQRQVMLVDLASNTTKPIGPRLPISSISWLKDDGGLLLGLDRYDGKPAGIATLIDGKVTEVGPGLSPTLLSNGRILFEDPDAQPTRWKTCTLQGTDLKLFDQGLQHCYYIAISPDDSQMLLERFGGSNPQASDWQLQNIDGTNVRPLKLKHEHWFLPVWR